MLHTKFQGHWSIGSGEEDFLRFLPYMGMADLVAIGPVVSEEKSFEIVDGRTTEPAYTISYPGAFGSGELKI